jgi:branched-chain amino acid transport system substrate-binding protein
MKTRLLLLFAALLAACQPPEPVKVGFVAGLSGRQADLGISERNGALLAVDDANAAGGINGRRVELLVRDDQQTPERTASLVAELADAKVAFVVGPMTSSTAVAGAAMANQRKLVMISPAGTTDALSGKADYFYRCVADAPEAGRQQADFLYTQGRRRLAVLGDSNNRSFAASYSKALGQRFKERGGQLVLDAEFTSGSQTSTAKLAEQLLAPGPDAIVLIAGAVDAALLTQHVRRLQPQMTIAVTPWAGTEELVQLGGRAMEGTFVPQYFDRDSRAEAFVRFSERYRKRFGEAPGFPATLAHDAVSMGLAALQRRKSEQTLRDALQAHTEYPGLQRPTRIDRYGDGAGELYMTTVKDGRFELVSR